MQHLSPRWPVPPGEPGRTHFPTPSLPCMQRTHKLCGPLHFLFACLISNLFTFNSYQWVVYLLSTCLSFPYNSFLENKVSDMEHTVYDIIWKCAGQWLSLSLMCGSHHYYPSCEDLLSHPQTHTLPSSAPSSLLISTLLSADVDLRFLNISYKQNRFYRIMLPRSQLYHVSGFNSFPWCDPIPS